MSNKLISAELDITRLQAERDMLRAALENYATEENWNGWHATGKPWEIARAALEAKP